MEIILGKHNGFCFGVKRAVEGALSTTSNNKIYCLGELVHNKQVIEKLEENNITIIDSLDEASDNSIVIVRAHGVEEHIYNDAKNKNIELIDYTCPFVNKIHTTCMEYRDNNYFIFVVGIKDHPETIGNISYCGNNKYLITGIDDINDAIKTYKESNINKTMIIFQTTYNTIIAKEIIDTLKKEINNIEVNNTICLSTEQRQNEVKEISKEVDMMIIVGGKNSSNTNKLYDISKSNCDNTIKVETYNDLKDININYNKIGIISGASTPQEVVDEIITYIKKQDI